MRQAPKPSELLRQAEDSKAMGWTQIRFEVPPRQRFLERYPKVWDGVSVRTVGRRMDAVTLVNGETVMVTEALIVEAHVTTIIEAARREQARETWAANQPIAANHPTPRRTAIAAR